MLLTDTFSTAYRGLRRNPMRSLLTTLGIIIGVGSVVLMVSVGDSFKAYILGQVSQFSGNTFEVSPKGLEQFGKDTKTLTTQDFEAIAKLSTVQSVAPVVFVSSRVEYGKESTSSIVFGTTPEIFHNLSLTIDQGRMLSESDVKGAAPVIVIGSQAAQDLFGDSPALGKRVTLGSAKLTIVGVTKKVGVGQNIDSAVYTPITLARSLSGNTNTVDYISLQSKGQNDLTLLDIKTLLRQRHKIINPTDDTDKDNFSVRSFAQAASIIGTVTLSITLFLGLVAGISLLVGGIGIMNIMLVSVTERTPEIGLRKALGARQRDILLQFLVEAVFLTVTGGVIGVVGAVGIGNLLALIAGKFLSGFGYALPIFSIILSLGMAAGIGLLFGIYPAKRAAMLDPIEALRAE